MVCVHVHLSRLCQKRSKEDFRISISQIALTLEFICYHPFSFFKKGEINTVQLCINCPELPNFNTKHRIDMNI